MLLAGCSAILSGYNAPNTHAPSLQLVLVRFQVDVTRGSTISKASLQFRSADASCPVNAEITIYVEASGNSAPFDPAVSEERLRSEASVKWITTGGWKVILDSNLVQSHCGS